MFHCHVSLPKGHGYIYIYQAPTKGRITIYHYHKVGVLLILDIFWSFCVLIPNLGDHKPFLWKLNIAIAEAKPPVAAYIPRMSW